MENKYFRNPGDLSAEINTESKHFRLAGNLNEINNNEEKIERWRRF